MTLLAQATELRRNYLGTVTPENQEEHSQYFTPVQAANLMASLFTLPATGTLNILDPGAGTGILTAALVDRILVERPHLALNITAVEKDPLLINDLEATLLPLKALGHHISILNTDFIHWATATKQNFDLVIQNPPYKKIRANTETDQLLKTHNIFVPNLYAAFMSLGTRLLSLNGQQVSITPRSWMNGTYYKKFRRALLHDAALIQIHTFESRTRVFGDTNVLQESIIVRMDKSTSVHDVSISISEDHTSNISTRTLPYNVVCTEDFVFVPATEADSNILTWMQRFTHQLQDLGIEVSTGKIVDFRNRDKLIHENNAQAYPMIYSKHIQHGTVHHPLPHFTKPQWFETKEPKDEKLLVSPGTYVVVKRFSSKEEKRRISAAVFSSQTPIAFDNKTNYFHSNAHGLELEVAQGLANWLNSEQADSYFRIFSGHTQVNATDLRQMKFPSIHQLKQLAMGELAVDSLGGSR